VNKPIRAIVNKAPDRAQELTVAIRVAGSSNVQLNFNEPLHVLEYIKPVVVILFTHRLYITETVLC
jgi:hypothetical protein